ncbi:protein kinase [Streptomyces sp. NPDC047022]|uniref:protein kinase n=1 Tax=Streptomyces sp. NPDC047022 TaxID=3155737 RepID=UPI0033D0B62F
MDDYAGRVLADRYRLPLLPADAYELTETRAFDTYSGQEVLIRQLPLPEVVEAEVLDADGLPEGYVAKGGRSRGTPARTATRSPADPTVRRAIEAAQAAARIPDHPRLDQVFDVFAEGGSLWVVSELVPARTLAALLVEKPLAPYRAAEVASDVLMALRALHVHGWVHRNITPRTVLVCDDGRVVLTGLATGAAEEALCGYDPVPARESGQAEPKGQEERADRAGRAGRGDPAGPEGRAERAERTAPGSRAERAPGSVTGALGVGGSPGHMDPEAARRAAIDARANGAASGSGTAAGSGTAGEGTAGGGGVPAVGPRALESASDVRAARAGAIAAYRAGARAAARVQDEQRGAPAALPAPRPAGSGGGAPPQAHGQPGEGRPGAAPPGRIADPYGTERMTPWHGAVPRPASPAAHDHARTAPPGGTLEPGHGTGGPAASGAPTAPWSRRGPATALAAERARQARMAVVGPVTERWAPEQAGPVHENWQLAAPIGPATDLWALGALLFRVVQGNAPYPEENTAELVQLVCAEPPAYAEECGPLRPVVESLLRQDPTERPDFEELSGWLRSLIRSAPEPDAGTHVVAAPPADPGRLPIVRRRGELVRRRRAGLPATTHARHRRAKDERPPRPRRLGRTLLLLILLALAAAIAYAMVFMPKAAPHGGSSGTVGERTGATSDGAPVPRQTASGAGSAQPPGRNGSKSPSPSDDSAQTQTSGAPVAQGFTLRTDPEGFRVAVADGWTRTPKNGLGQIVYSQGDFELIVVPGRDTTSRYGADPLTYQRESEPELQPFRDSTWATSSGMRRIDVGGLTMVEGQFTWADSDGRELFVRNSAVIVAGRYHVVQVRGPEAERDEVTRLYEQAQQTYRAAG